MEGSNPNICPEGRHQQNIQPAVDPSVIELHDKAARPPG